MFVQPAASDVKKQKQKHWHQRYHTRTATPRHNTSGNILFPNFLQYSKLSVSQWRGTRRCSQLSIRRAGRLLAGQVTCKRTRAWSKAPYTPYAQRSLYELRTGSSGGEVSGENIYGLRVDIWKTGIPGPNTTTACGALKLVRIVEIHHAGARCIIILLSRCGSYQELRLGFAG